MPCIKQLPERLLKKNWGVCYSKELMPYCHDICAKPATAALYAFNSLLTMAYNMNNRII